MGIPPGPGHTVAGQAAELHRGWREVATTHQVGKAFFLSKVQGFTTDPMDCRVLLILPRLYRRWAGLRLCDLESWVREWQLPEMYAGVPGGGAEMAWWQASLLREDAFHDQRDVIAGALDIYKCFDQIVPLLVEVTLSLAGCPWQVLGPYRDMMRGVRPSTCCPRELASPTGSAALSHRGVHLA